MALRLKPLTDGIPLDITVVATHAVAGHIAVEAGFRKVINLVVDNYAQHFNAVPGAINAVQAGALGAAYAKLGYQTVLAGHWADRRSVEGIHTDTARRMKRIHNKAVRRLVISIGGAGAQATFVIELLAALQPGMAAKTWHVVLNCGDAKETQARVPNPNPNPDPDPDPNPNPNPNPEQLFNHMDADGTGRITYTEFEGAVRRDMQISTKEITTHALTAVWAALDTDSTGFVAAGEFGAFMRRGEHAVARVDPKAARLAIAQQLRAALEAKGSQRMHEVARANAREARETEREAARLESMLRRERGNLQELTS